MPEWRGARPQQRNAGRSTPTARLESARAALSCGAVELQGRRSKTTNVETIGCEDSTGHNVLDTKN